MNIIGPLLLLGGAVFVVAKRCELLGLCGETSPDSGDTSVVDDSSSSTVTDNPDAAANADSGTLAGASAKTGCCECKMVGDRVKCRQNGGDWFNPPAGPGGSNDLSVGLSMQECLKTCGSSSKKSTSNKSSGGSSSAAKVGSQGNPGYKAPTSNKPSTGNLGEKGTTYVQKPVKATGSASYLNKGSGYKPGGGTYYTYNRPVYRSYFADPYNPRPFRLFHRIAN